MSESLITFFGIYFLSLFKFIAGPLLGSAAGYSLFEIILVTVSGMMTSVAVFSIIGTRFKRNLALRFKRKSPVFSKKSRRIVRLWTKYGEVGIAFMTPLFLTPIGGTLILVSFGTKKRKIYFHMLWSALFWSIFFGLTIDQLLQIPFLDRLLR
jgi:membrane protein DedA with SNARE-associated domain